MQLKNLIKMVRNGYGNKINLLIDNGMNYYYLALYFCAEELIIPPPPIRLLPIIQFPSTNPFWFLMGGLVFFYGKNHTLIDEHITEKITRKNQLTKKSFCLVLQSAA